MVRPRGRRADRNKTNQRWCTGFWWGDAPPAKLKLVTMVGGGGARSVSSRGSLRRSVVALAIGGDAAGAVYSGLQRLPARPLDYKMVPVPCAPPALCSTNPGTAGALPRTRSPSRARQRAQSMRTLPTRPPHTSASSDAARTGAAGASPSTPSAVDCRWQCRQAGMHRGNARVGRVTSLGQMRVTARPRDSRGTVLVAPHCLAGVPSPRAECAPHHNGTCNKRSGVLEDGMPLRGPYATPPATP